MRPADFLKRYTDPIKYAVVAICFVAAAGAGIYVVRSYNDAIETAIDQKAQIAALDTQVVVLRRDYGAATKRIDDFDKALRDQARQAQHLADVANAARAENNRLTEYYTSGQMKEDLDEKPVETAGVVSLDFNAAFGVLACRSGNATSCSAQGGPDRPQTAASSPD